MAAQAQPAPGLRHVESFLQALQAFYLRVYNLHTIKNLKTLPLVPRIQKQTLTSTSFKALPDTPFFP